MIAIEGYRQKEIDSSIDNYKAGFPTSSTLQRREDYRSVQKELTEGRSTEGKYKRGITEVIIVDSNPKLIEEMTKKAVAEKDLIIHELTARLAEFERAHSFMPSKFHLPDDYFDDLVE